MNSIIKITIVDDEENADGKSEGVATSQANADGGNDGDDILYLQLDCRSYPDLNFPRVMEYEVCDALCVEFEDDVHKAVKTGRGMQIGTFRIESENMQQYMGKSYVYEITTSN